MPKAYYLRRAAACSGAVAKLESWVRGLRR